MVVLRSRALPDLRLNVDEYLHADLPEGQRYELVEEVVEMTPAPDPDHEETRSILNRAFYEFQATHPEAFQAVIQHAAVSIPEKQTVREPDIAVYARWRGRGSGRQAWKEIIPLLAVEVVSPGQASRDYRDKRVDYWLAGIAEYWIVDAQEERVTVLARGERDWVESMFTPGQDIRSVVLPGFSIAVQQLFER